MHADISAYDRECCDYKSFPVLVYHSRPFSSCVLWDTWGARRLPLSTTLFPVNPSSFIRSTSFFSFPDIKIELLLLCTQYCHRYKNMRIMILRCCQTLFKLKKVPYLLTSLRRFEMLKKKTNKNITKKTSLLFTS